MSENMGWIVEANIKEGQADDLRQRHAPLAPKLLKPLNGFAR